ncbi:TatD family hydrolase [Shewanella dokdonensis]|uniref:TatD family hydrolase n=1 Tax=Shewanella dokdonensis TaxID=712036 RepID=A0ABX8DAS9_9GAMM|nr:TatD family hydrolase [Shewanella dokdonensis]MCL1075245.1 TatD family hydrolase [Shewanella dokdonensis]QVK21963.1 TatD family hydrolase [Shewanella dokdonensis]
MRYMDIAVNLIGSKLEQDLLQVLQDATDVRVSPLLLIGSDLAESERCIQVAQQYPRQLYTTAGVHPHHADSWQAHSLQQLTELCSHAPVVAVGECGLDFDRNYSSRAQQLAAFEAQLALAAELQLPVLMHQREAHDDFLNILSRYRSSLPAAVLHCFTGDKQQVADYNALDLYLGITGWVCDERRGQALAAAVPEIPADRLVLETDSPYLLPRSMRPKPKSGRNEPKYLPYIAEVVAELRQQPPQQLAQQCYQNSLRLFGLESI